MKKLFLALAALALVVTPAKADSTVVVTPGSMATSIGDVVSDPSKWLFYNDETDAVDPSLGSFVTGPATPPLGSDSVQISVSGTQRRNLATYQFSGTVLSTITALSFDTYNPSVGNPGSTNRSAYLNFNVDFNGTDTWQSRLVFLPSDNGTVLQDTWQTWDAIGDGSTLWRYSGATWPGTATPGTTTRTWTDILTSYPGVRVRVNDAHFALRVGEPYADGYTENIDAFRFGTASGVTTFNFEKVYPTTGVITYPVADGDHVSGVVSLTATYDDGDAVNDDAVQWAVRHSTCAVATGTVFGNVDGHSDSSTWDGANFSASIDTGTLVPGDTYCFVFNPTDDAGENDVRLTREFVVDQVLVGPPTSKDQCKNDGWKTFNNPVFANQGACVSYVEHHDGHGNDDHHDNDHHDNDHHDQGGHHEDNHERENRYNDYKKQALAHLREVLAKLHRRR